MKLIIFVVCMQVSVLMSMDVNNNNNNNNLATAWPIALQKPSLSPQERLANLTIEQKIAQLFMPGMQLNDHRDFEKVTELIKKYPIGGVLLTHSASSNLAVTYIQNLHDTHASRGHPIPLWISIDAEWGLGMRLLDGISFAKAMPMGAGNDLLVYKYGKEIGRQSAALGAHINFAPVVDVNNNQANPVIGSRSFGQDPKKVILMAFAYWAGVGDQVLSCAKHFPGHGDTDVDSHLALPVLNHTLERLHAVELEPFKALIQCDIPMVMIAHLLIPVLDEKLPASLSPKVIDDLLRKQLGFKGLVITDGLKMKAVADTYNSADLALLAFKAGNDIILQLDDTAAGIEALIAAYKCGEITQEQIDERVARIWRAKGKQGLLEKDPRPQDYKEAVFHTEYAYDLQQLLYEAAMTLVNNDNQMLPITNSMIKETLLFDIGNAAYFAQALEKEGVTVKRLSRIFNREEVVKIQYGNFKNIIISIANMNKFAQQSYGISEDAQYLCQYVQGLKDLHLVASSITINENSVPQDIKMIVQKENEKVGTVYESPKKSTLVLFGMPYAASLLDHQGLLVAYEDCLAAQLAAAKVVMGKYNLIGKLPVSIGTKYPAGTGVRF